MKIVVDTNRIIAALVKDSASRKILLSDKFSFLTVEVAKSEIKEHRGELLDKTKLTDKELNTILSILFSKVLVVSDVVIEGKMHEAEQIMDAIDPSDTPFMALALAVENDGIWSDDEHFKKQSTTKVWKTVDLLTLIRKGLV